MTRTSPQSEHLPDERRPRRRRGFTIVEILVVVAVIILLLSILIVALNKAAASAQVANTRNLMGTLRQALIQFKDDVGYYPPVLDETRALVEPPTASFSAGDQLNFQSWFSITSPADYLIGYGNAQQDGYGAPGDVTRPAPGIRSPGRDGVWGATLTGNGALAARNSGAGTVITGQVLGPYLELKDERLLATVDTDGPGQLRYPGDPDYSLEDTSQAGIIVDYWGRPIRYYRRPYPRGALGQSLRAVDRDGDGLTDPPPTLSEIFVLRPYEIPTGGAIDAGADANGDTASTIELNAAEFGLLSFGADGVIDETARRDDEDGNGDGIAQSNRDNIVETGP
jgi:type II secretory pathway pseudopilin PulG